MLCKIISIANVGRFSNFSATGDVALKRYNLVYAENGRGKTTLCAILRSLRSGEPAHVLGRTTLGSGEPPRIQIRVDETTAAFGAGAWNTTVPEIAVYDSSFVSENVYSGHTVDLDQRRRLYRVIIGEGGVELAHRIEELDAATRAKSTEIREKLGIVQGFVPLGLDVDRFLALRHDPTIDDRIAEKKRELQAVKEAEQVLNRDRLVELSLPTLPANFETILAASIEGIAVDAEDQVATQIKRHSMSTRGEAWLAEGLGFARSDSCPFCSQEFSEAAETLLAAYRAYFGREYHALRDRIADLRTEIEKVLGDEAVFALQRAVERNIAALEFWSRYCEISPPERTGEIGAPGGAMRDLLSAALALLDLKAAAPLDPIAPDEALDAARNAFDAFGTEVVSYNAAVRTANALITQKKAATASAEAESIERELHVLEGTKIRHQPQVEAACLAYDSVRMEKEGLEENKEEAKKNLDDYSMQVLGRYEQSINKLLGDFNAGFKITGTKHGYPGGVASTTYQVLINDTAVELGDERTPIDRPSFRNTLSSGDRSTLALAFFLARLEHSPERAAKVVVFDDPFSSQDSFRKDCTVQKIKECGEACSQVVVLSHDRGFLHRVWDRLIPHAGDRKCLQLARVGERDTRIAAWDIEEAVQTQYLSDRRALTQYFTTASGNPRDIVNKIRPVLETWCRNLYPCEFGSEALGTIISKVRAGGSAHQLFPLLSDLEILNEYTCRYHHGENPNAGTEPINDAELQGFVRKTLKMTGGC